MRSEGYQNIILQWDAVPVLDAGGLNAFLRFSETLSEGKQLIITDLPFQPLKTLARAKVHPIEGRLSFYGSLAQAIEATMAQRGIK